MTKFLANFQGTVFACSFAALFFDIGSGAALSAVVMDLGLILASGFSYRYMLRKNFETQMQNARADRMAKTIIDRMAQKRKEMEHMIAVAEYTMKRGRGTSENPMMN